MDVPIGPAPFITKGSKMRQLPTDTLYDKRLIKRHVKEGLISGDDVSKRLQGLMDAESMGEPIDMSSLLGESSDEPAGEAQASAANDHDSASLTAV